MRFFNVQLFILLKLCDSSKQELARRNAERQKNAGKLDNHIVHKMFYRKMAITHCLLQNYRCKLLRQYRYAVTQLALVKRL